MTEHESAPRSAPLIPLVRAMIGETETLAGLLAQEQSALATADVDLLEAVNAEKFDCVDRIEALESARRRLLAQAGFSFGADAMRQIGGADPDLAASWSELMALTRRCRSQNQENAAVGRLRQAQLRDALVLLSGQPDCAPVYGATGLDAGGAARRELGQA